MYSKEICRRKKNEDMKAGDIIRPAPALKDASKRQHKAALPLSLRIYIDTSNID